MLKKNIEDALHHAMKKNEELTMSVLRMLLAAIRNREIEKRMKLFKSGITENVGATSLLTDEEALEVIRSEAKKRRDAIREYEKASRNEFAQKETKELAILQVYLPPEMNDGDVEHIIKEVIATLKTNSMKDFGRIMGEIMKRLKGKVSGERIGRILKQYLE